MNLREISLGRSIILIAKAPTFQVGNSYEKGQGETWFEWEPRNLPKFSTCPWSGTTHNSNPHRKEGKNVYCQQ